MGYWKDNGEFADVDEAHFGSGLILATRFGEALGTDRGAVRLTLNVTAITGTPSLDVTLETSEDKITWRLVGTFAQAVAVSRQRKVIGGLDKYVRVHEVFGGSGSVTRDISGEFV